MYAPERILFVAPDGALCHGRTLERPRQGEPTRLLVMRGCRLELVFARHSPNNVAATWHYPAKPN